MKNKGFTLIEIMIVIAIIGILALVLVPKIGAMKDQAKLAGVDTNTRVVEAIAQSMLTDYKAANILTLETDLTAKLPKDVENPFTNAVDVAKASAIVGGNKAFGYLGDATGQGAPTAPANNANMKGVVAYAAWTTGAATTDVNVTIWEYDQAGNRMTAKDKTLTK